MLCLIRLNYIANFSRHFFSCGARFASLVVCSRRRSTAAAVQKDRRRSKMAFSEVQIAEFHQEVTVGGEADDLYKLGLI